LKDLKKHISNIFLEENDDCDYRCICPFDKYFMEKDGKLYLASTSGLIELVEIKKSSNQEAKADNGKPKLTLVPRKIIFDIARVREYGNKKYGDPDNWKTVEKERYRDAAYRHFMAYLDDPTGVDEESGLPHLWHWACNCAFLCEMEDLK